MPPVPKKKVRAGDGGFGDRPDGHDPRDQYVGHKRIDVPVVKTSGDGKIPIEKVRFNCIRTINRAGLTPTSDVYLRQFSVHKKSVPWA